METIEIPFKPRDYQLPLLNAIDSGEYNRAIAVWHRRSGKDLALWNLIIKKALIKKGLYYYFLPTYEQARKVIYDGMTYDGTRFLDYIPRIAIQSKTTQPMKITLKNGSIVTLIGTDNYDAIRGTNPTGIVFSEAAFQNPMAWEVVKPIVKFNKECWVVFNSTPNGKNHFYDLLMMAQDNDNWFTEILTVDDTKIVDKEDIEAERKEGTTEEMIQQEYYCSFDIGALGSYYANLVKDAKDQDRICRINYQTGIPVDTYWDLGRNDQTNIGFVQQVGKEIRVIDFYENSGYDIGHFLDILRDKKYRYDKVYLPHDARQERLEAKKSIEDQVREAGYQVEIIPLSPIPTGIQQLRKVFPNLWFDSEKCGHLIRCLENYHKEYDEKAKVFKQTPKHDWSSHSADMMRYLAMGIREQDTATEYDYNKIVEEIGL